MSQRRGFLLVEVTAPRPGLPVARGGVLNGGGHAFGDSAIARIEVRLGRDLLTHAEYGLARPHLAESFPHFPAAGFSGFSFTAILPEAPETDANLTFVFHTEDGQHHSREVALDWGTLPDPRDTSGPRLPPIRIGLETCRLDGDGRLVVRGYALAREDIPELALFLGNQELPPPETGLSRPEMGRRHAAYRQAAHSGFRLVHVLERPVEPGVAIRLTARSGPHRRQIIAPLLRPGEASQWLRADAVTLCCEVARLDTDRALTLAGWAVGESPTRAIEIWAGQRSLGLAEIGLARPDIGNRFPRLPGARRGGFRFTCSLPRRVSALTLRRTDETGQETTLRLPVAGSEPTRPAVPDEAIAPTLGLEAPLPRNAGLVTEWRGTLTLSGFAFVPGGRATLTEIEIWAEDRKLADAHHGLRREDLAAQYPDVPAALTAGFAALLPPGDLPPGEHVLRIIARSDLGGMTERTLRVVVMPEDDRQTGRPRRLVSLAETALRQQIWAGLGQTPRFSVLIRRPGRGGAAGLGASLESLGWQDCPDWQATVLCRDATEQALLDSCLSQMPRIAPRVTARLPAEGAIPWLEKRPEARDFLAVLRAGDRFGADAFSAMACEAAVSGADFVYADERGHDKATGTIRPFAKPGWSPTLLTGFNYIGRAWCAQRELVEGTGIDVGTIEHLGEYEALLRLTERASLVAHLPHFLAERVGPIIESPEREHAALTRAARRRKWPNRIIDAPVPGARVMLPAVPRNAKVSIIIPTKGARGLIRDCLDQLRRLNRDRIEIIILDGIDQTESGLREYVAATADQVIRMTGPFNWSHANNTGARAASGAFLLFLNDDVVPRDTTWLDALLARGAERGVGAAGAKLLYPDGTVQHAGMFLRGAEGIHAFRCAPGNAPGAFGLAALAREVTAVTGACLLTRREVFNRLGGFDEAHDLIKNDLDYCLRLGETGLRVVYAPEAQLVHHEMASRVSLPDSHDADAFRTRWANRLAAGDGLRNPNLTADDTWHSDPEALETLIPGGPLLDRAAIRAVLAVKLDHIGDMVSALPALMHLRQTFPAARLHLLAQPDTAALAQKAGMVDHVIPFQFFAGRAGSGARPIAPGEYETLAARLRPHGFDFAVDLRTHPDTRPILRQTGARVLAGFDRDGAFPWLDIAVEWEGDVPLRRKRSPIADSLTRLAAAIEAATGEMPFFAPLTTPRPARVLVHAGAGSALKTWPEANFVALIRLLRANHDVDVTLIGGTEESLPATRILSAVDDARVRSMVGRVTLESLPALMRGASLFVGNDSGPKHLAASLGVPTVGIHAAHVDAAEWGPNGPRALALQRRMTCGPCYIARESECPRRVACLREISPGQVYRACRTLLALVLSAPG